MTRSNLRQLEALSDGTRNFYHPEDLKLDDSDIEFVRTWANDADTGVREFRRLIEELGSADESTPDAIVHQAYVRGSIGPYEIGGKALDEQAIQSYVFLEEVDSENRNQMTTPG